MPRQCPDTVPGEIPYKKYTRVKNLAAAVAEDQKILYFINLLFYSVHARAAIGNSYGALSQGTVGALSGHCQGTVKCVRKRLCVIVRICAHVCAYLRACVRICKGEL